MRLLVAAASVLALAQVGCESCEFSFGPAIARIVVTSNVPEQDLVVEVCDQTDDAAGAHCLPATECTGAGDGVCSRAGIAPPGARLFSTEIRFAGVFSCASGPFVATARASNCATRSTLHGESGEQDPRVDIVLTCN